MTHKIAIVAGQPASLINFRLHLIKDFMAKGYAVTAISSHDEEVSKQLEAIGVMYTVVPISRNGKNPLNDLHYLYKLWQCFRQERPQYVLSYTIKPVIYAGLAAQFAGIRRIYSMITGTGYAFYNTGLKSRIIGGIAKTLLKISLKNNTLIFFQNKDNLNQYLQEAIITPQQATAIIHGSGVDIDHFSDTPKANVTAISFIMVARLLIDKGVREYVEAAKIIKQRYPHISFKLAGEFDTNPNVIQKQELDTWVQQGIIEYLGKLSDVRPAIASSSVFVLPSYHEGTPRSVLEAMAMNKPIITTDAPGCRETVVPQLNGLLVPIKDAKQLSEAMEYFIANPEQIIEMGKASRIIAVEKYNVNKVNQTILHAMGMDNHEGL